MGSDQERPPVQRDAVAAAVVAAAERFCVVQSVGLTSKRLLYEFLAYAGPNGKTTSGLWLDGVAPDPKAAVQLALITRKFMGFHIIKHYYRMRQYKEATGIVLAFLKFLRAEATLPAAFTKELDAAIAFGEEGVAQLPHIMRIIRSPDARNEVYSRLYPLRPFPLCTVPSSAKIKESSSRSWPANTQQVHHAWINYAAQHCKADFDELEGLIKSTPHHLTITAKEEGPWEVVSVRPDGTIVFKPWRGERRFEVPFTQRRAADFLPGSVVMATLVTLSDGSCFMTDWGYTFPPLFAPFIEDAEAFQPFDHAQLVYEPGVLVGE